MKHATAETFMSIGHLLQHLRSRKRLVERTPGAFYFKSKAFLHFHHDPPSPPATLTRRERRLALELIARIKRSFDPLDILNPGKVVRV